MNINTRIQLTLAIIFLSTTPVFAAPGDGLQTLSAKPLATTQQAFTRTIDEVDFGPCPEWMPDGCGLSVIQGDPEQPNADVLLRMSPNSVVSEHWHTSAERMIVMSGQMRFDYVGHEPIVAEPGDYLYGPAGLAHTTYCLDAGECVLFVVFEDPVDAIDVVDQTAPNPPNPDPFMMSIDEAFSDNAIPCPVDEAVPTPNWPEGCQLAIVQALDPDGNNWDAMLWLEPGTKIPMHWHSSAERMVLLHGNFRVNYHGQAPVLIEPFTYAYGPAELPHDAICADSDAGQCVLFIAFETPIDAIAIRGGNVPYRRGSRPD